MKPVIHNGVDANIRSMLATVRAETLHQDRSAGLPLPVPFVTISRQAGAGGRSLARRLAEMLNARESATPALDAPRWAVWDNELVEKVCTDHHIARQVVEALERSQHPWLTDLLEGFSCGDGGAHPDEFMVYRRVAGTVVALAKAGRAIIVGRGGVFLTKDLPGGVHVRLVAPRDNRVRATVRRMNAPLEEAARWVDHVDRGRAAFCKRYWPGRPIDAEAFTVSLDTSDLTDEQMAAAVLQLVPSRAAQHPDRPTAPNQRPAEAGAPVAAVAP